jgi:formylglycine-generating enzyme required for sulfatase activity
MASKKGKVREPKLRVFVSSTFLDQEERRRLVIDAIERAGLEPVAMERFAGRTVSPLQNDVELVQDCDLYLGILAYRYGSLPPGEQRSHTEIEHDAAQAAGIDRIVIVVDRDKVKLPVDVDADQDLQQRLDRFVERVQRELTVPRFHSDADLVSKVWHSLVAWLQAQGRQPAGAGPDMRANPRHEQLSRYRDAVLAEHGTLQMVGFASTVRAPIQTTALYVDLQAAAVPHHGEHADAEAGLDDGEPDRLARFERLGMSQALALAARRQRHGLVVRGYPGAGKTTFLKRLAVACVQQGSHTFALPDRAVPIVIPLRQLTAADYPQPLAHWVAMTLPPQLGDTFDRAGFVAWLLAQDEFPLLLLVDGLDETPSDTERRLVADQVCSLLRPARPVVLTTRFAGYTDVAAAPLAPATLLLDLQPFTPEQTEQFIGNWYRIVECHHEPHGGATRAESSAADLVARLQKPAVQASRVLEFTANPLLLTILCIVHRDSAHLPEQRERLYRELVQVLLEGWRRGKRLPVHLTADQALKVLLPVAKFLHARPSRTRATAAELAEVMREPLRRIGWRGSAEDFLRHVRDDSGILAGHSGDTYGFLHLGIQEYLAARAVEVDVLREPETIRDQFEAVAAHYGDPWWREILLLLLALPERPFFRYLFGHVVGNPRFGTEDLMLEDCLREAAEPDVRPFVEFLSGTAAQMPRDDGLRDDLRRRQLVAVRAIRQLAQRTGDDHHLAAARDAFRDVAPRQDDLDRELWAMLGLAPTSSVPAQARSAEPNPPLRTRQQNGIDLVPIPAGEFLMGSPPGTGHSDERPQRRIRIAQPFWLARTPVTNAQYRAFVEATRHPAPSSWGNVSLSADDQPVVEVSWDDAQAFCRWAGLRLPSEAEWEYACRAGTTKEFWFGDGEDRLGEFGWYESNAGGRPRPVATKPPSLWGLHDVHGNVWEWCEDWKAGYEKAPSDGSPQRTAHGSGDRVLRGGSWYDFAGGCRSAYRVGGHPAVRWRGCGFRPASSSP